jgi:hypothetical protein
MKKLKKMIAIDIHWINLTMTPGKTLHSGFKLMLMEATR